MDGTSVVVVVCTYLCHTAIPHSFVMLSIMDGVVYGWVLIQVHKTQAHVTSTCKSIPGLCLNPLGEWHTEVQVHAYLAFLRLSLGWSSCKYFE